MKIGIRAHDVISSTPDVLFKKVKEFGFDYIQLVFKKALKDEDNKPLIFNEYNARIINTYLREYNIDVCMLGAYFNPVHSNKELLLNNVNYFIDHLRFASLLNAKYVGTETGSYNDDKWTYNPKNQTEEGYQDTIKVFKNLVSYAEKYQTTLLMEPAWGHVIYSPKVLKRAVDEINSNYLKVTIDLFNLLYIGNYQNYKEIFDEALNIFKDDIKIIHLKDFYIKDDKIVQCGLGKGIIDFKFIIDKVKEYCPNVTLVFEGVTGEDIIPSLNLIKSFI